MGENKQECSVIDLLELKTGNVECRKRRVYATTLLLHIDDILSKCEAQAQAQNEVYV